MPNHKGVDLSHFQETVDFGEMKKAGVEFVALKATDGASFVDPTFHDRQARARAVGFRHLLFYHFVRPESPILAQSESFARTVGKLQPGEAMVLDVEAAIRSGRDTWKGIEGEASAMLVKAFVYHLKTALGISASQVVLYGSIGWLRGQFGDSLEELTFMPLWAARYASQLGDVSPWPKAMLWQYSESGSVPGAGAPGTVDLDVWMDPQGWAA